MSKPKTLHAKSQVQVVKFADAPPVPSQPPDKAQELQRKGFGALRGYRGIFNRCQGICN